MVTANWINVGGIVGYLTGRSSSIVANVYNCYNTGAVTSIYGVVGGIVGWATRYTNVFNCYNTGEIETTITEDGDNPYGSAGGILGYIVGYSSSVPALVYNCYNTGSVTAAYYDTGGIIADSDGFLEIYNCYNTGEIVGDYYSGGIIGVLWNTNTGIIKNCYNAGNVSATNSAGYAGGIAGWVYAHTTLCNCYNTGDVEAEIATGGVVGRLGVDSSTSYTGMYLYNCFNIGSVSATTSDGTAGGIVGVLYDTSAKIANCYYGEGTITEYQTTYTQGIGGTAGSDTYGQTDYLSNIAALAKTFSWFFDSSNWNSTYPWDFDEVWAFTYVSVNNGYPILRDFTAVCFEYYASADYWYYEDGMFPQSVVSDSTLIANLEAGAALSGGSYVVGSVVFDGWSYDGEEYVKVTASGANGTADDSGCTWFLVESIVWIVGYGETLSTDFSTAVSAKIVTLGAYASSSANSTFVSLYSSTLTNALLALSNESLSISVSDSIIYDLFNTTASQTAVFSVNLGNATSSNTTVTSAGYRVASVNEIDALGGAYAAECSDFVAFLLSGGTSTSGSEYGTAAYWTRDLAYSLAADSYYGTAHGSKAYSYDGTYNQGVYVTSDGIISNATLKNVFGARLSVSV